MRSFFKPIIISSAVLLISCAKQAAPEVIDNSPFKVAVEAINGVTNGEEFSTLPSFRVSVSGEDVSYILTYRIDGDDLQQNGKLWIDHPVTIYDIPKTYGWHYIEGSVRLKNDDTGYTYSFRDSLCVKGEPLTGIEAFFVEGGRTVPFTKDSLTLSSGSRMITIKHTPASTPATVKIITEGGIDVEEGEGTTVNGEFTTVFNTNEAGPAGLTAILTNGDETYSVSQNLNITSEILKPSFSFDISAGDIGTDKNDLVIEFSNFNIIINHSDKSPEFFANVYIDGATVLQTKIALENGKLPSITISNSSVTFLTKGTHTLNVHLKLDYDKDVVEYSNSCEFAITYTAITGAKFYINHIETDEVYIKEGETYELLIAPQPEDATIESITINKESERIQLSKEFSNIYRISIVGSDKTPAIDKVTISVNGVNGSISKEFTIYEMQPLNYAVKWLRTELLITPTAAFDLTGLSLTVNAKLTYGEYMHGKREYQHNSNITPVQYIYKPTEGFRISDPNMVNLIESNYITEHYWEDIGRGLEYIEENTYYVARLEKTQISVLVNPSYKFYKNLYMGTITKDGSCPLEELSITTNPYTGL